MQKLFSILSQPVFMSGIKGKFSFLTGMFMLGILISILPRVNAQPAGFVDEVFASGFAQAVGLTFDENGRMYVWEKGGKVWIVENGVKSATPLIDLSEEVGNWRDFGMLGFALDPNFLTNGHIYLLYIVDRHHLFNYGTPSYNPATNEYFNATIGRITRYTAEASTNYSTVDYSSRLVLLGETPSTGLPHLHESHGIGSLAFGKDGTLMVTMGDGASYSSVDQGSASETYWSQALADGIIASSENVGAYRCQMLTSLNGKVLRLDPATGDGLPSNPYYDSANPRSPASRIWARGLRNPCRMSIVPGTGSHDPADGNPGVLMIGDVGWGAREELNICAGPGLNFGWPRHEGADHLPGYNNSSYFPATHTWPAVQWRNGQTAKATVGGTLYNVGSSQVPGPQFGGNCSIGGIWYDGTSFPSEYQGTYFHADYGGDWIMNFSFDGSYNPTEIKSFKTGANAIVFVGLDPSTGDLYWIGGAAGNSNNSANVVHRISYNPTGNQPPVADATSDIEYGPGPLTVNFDSEFSYDPEGSQLTYAWDFGDGNTSTQAAPSHTFTPATSSPTTYKVILTVTDGIGQTSKDSLNIYANNTPPQIVSTSLDGTTSFLHDVSTFVILASNAVDAEHSASELSYVWQQALFHNDHSHFDPPIYGAGGTGTISPIGCDGVTYWYRFILTVSDPTGLSSSVTFDLYPDCPGTSQTITFNPIPDKTTADGPFTISTSASSGLPVSHYLIEGPATLVGNTVTLDGVPGIVTIRAVQGGDTITWAPAVPVERSFKVTGTSIFCENSGSILMEKWSGVAGTAVADIPLTTFPTSITSLNIFEIPADVEDNYGARVRGYLCPPVTGNYTFWISSDDNGELWLSTDDDPANKALIANVPGWTSSRQWDKFPEQQSSPVFLTAGQKYYVEALMKEQGGGDNLAVGWQLPSGVFERPIVASRISPYEDPNGFQTQGSAVQTDFNCYTITPDAGSQAGAVWYNNQVSLSGDLTVDFDLNLGSNDAGADGVAFVFQNSAQGKNALGGLGGGLGISGISPSLIVEFDTYNNGAGDLADDHISISLNGVTGTNEAGPVCASTTCANIEDGLDHQVSIVWLAATQTLNIYFDGNLRLSHTIDLVQNVFGGNSSVWMGLSGGTGGATNLQSFCNLTVTSKENQTISFGSITDKLTTDAPFNVNATASSGLPVSFSVVSGPASVSGNTVTLTGQPGTVVLRASQAGDASYYPAPDVDQSFDVNEPVSVVQTSSQISSGDDDAEENTANGNVGLTSSDLEITEDGTKIQLVGVRFSGLNIPPGATIQSSWIQFTVDEIGAGASSVNIAGEASDNAPAFSNSNGNISSRTLTGASVVWAIPDWNTVGESGANQQSPDLSAVIQEIVSRPGWTTTSALALILSGSGDRTAESFNGSASGAPVLHVEYAVSGNIAPNAQISASPISGFDPLDVSFDATGSDDPDGTIVSYSWDFGDGNNGTGASVSHTYNGIGTYTATLTVTDDDGDNDTETIDITVNPSSGTVSSSSQVSTGDDDAEENLANGSVSLTSSDLELAEDGTKVQLVGMRFAGLDIPPGALITNAWIQFTNDENRSGASSLTIKGEASDDALSFSNTGGNISSRPVTSATVPWSIPDWLNVGEAGPAQQTPDLSSIVQEIVSRPGWATPSALVIMIEGTGRRAAESYNGSPGGAPVLHVEYSAGSGNLYPVASFTATPESGQVDLNVSFDGSASNDPDGTIVSYDWDYGDGNNGTGVTSGHTYTVAGTYTAVLTVTDDEGAIHAASTEIVVLPAGLIQTSAQPGGSSDDSEENIATGAISLNSSDLELGTEAGTSQLVGIRFAGLNIPSGALIQNAWIQFTVDEIDGDLTSLNIRGELTPDAQPFTSTSGDISSRTTTAASVGWSPDPWNSVGQADIAQQTPDLTGIVQEIVDQAGWTSSSALAIIIDGTGERTAESYNGSAGDAPVLHVEYSLGSAPGARIGRSDDSKGTIGEIVVKLYPNPFTEHFFVEIISPEEENMEVEMVDVRGRRIFYQEHASSQQRIRIEKPIPAGIYFVRVIHGSVRKDFKVMKYD